MRDAHAESLERLLTGELSRDEERQLAQAALSDPDLFDALTAASVAKTALASSQRPARRTLAVIAALAAAATLAIAVAYWSRAEPANPAVPAPTATVASTPADIAPPILLTARVEAGSAPTFRAEASSSSRLPKETGAIVQVEAATADIDLGSLDGLKQGDAVRIVRGQRPLGRMSITTVFRERARGQVEAGVAAVAGDRIEIAPIVHINALLELSSARRAVGDLARARELATMAATRASGAGLLSDVQRQSRVELSTVLNELGALQIEQREFQAAEQSLRSAQSSATGTLLARITNNLGALAAIRGDRAEAERLYREADSIAAGSAEAAPDRQTIAKNRAALHAAR